MISSIARFLARPKVAAAVIRFSMRHPFIHIGDYMERYWIVPFTRWLPFSIRVHHILRPDGDLDLHDHPWNWRTIIMRGWYIEEDVFGDRRARVAGDTTRRSAETFHRITAVSEGGVWTLFIMGRKSNRWGFMTGSPPRKVYYRDYLSANTKEGPQS